jgi:hypothetical protein
MEVNTTLLSTTTGTTILGLLILVYRAVNGKKIHSKCCDHDIEMGVQVENMTPPKVHIPQQNEFKTNPLILSKDKNDG